MIIALVSGGMDSYIGCHMLKEANPSEEILPVYYNYAGNACETEMKLVQKQFKSTKHKLKIINKVFDFSSMEEGEEAFIYGRNMHFATAASRFGQSIALFGHKNSNFGDNTAKFRNNLSATLTVMKGELVNIFSPIENMEKEDVVDWWIKHCFDENVPQKEASKKLFELTTSCTEGPHFCRNCPNCFYFLCALWDHTHDWTKTMKSKIEFKNMDVIRKYLKLAEQRELPGRRAQTVREIADFYKVSL